MAKREINLYLMHLAIEDKVSASTQNQRGTFTSGASRPCARPLKMNVGLMRKTYFDAVNRTEPYSALYDAGATPAQVKAVIVDLLQAYIPNRSRLQQFAVSALATEAVCIGQLLSRKDWEKLLRSCFAIRKRRHTHKSTTVI